MSQRRRHGITKQALLELVREFPDDAVFVGSGTGCIDVVSSDWETIGRILPADLSEPERKTS